MRYQIHYPPLGVSIESQSLKIDAATCGMREIVSTTLLAVEQGGTGYEVDDWKPVQIVNFSYRDFDLKGELRTSAFLAKCDDFLDGYFRKARGVKLGVEWDYVLRRASVEHFEVATVGASLGLSMKRHGIGDTSFSIDYSFCKGLQVVAAVSIVYVSISVTSPEKSVTPSKIRKLIEEIP